MDRYSDTGNRKGRKQLRLTYLHRARSRLYSEPGLPGWPRPAPSPPQIPARLNPWDMKKDSLHAHRQSAATLSVDAECLAEPKQAGDETRTRDIFLGKEVLYQLSYTRVLWIGGGNHASDAGRIKKYLRVLESAVCRVSG